MATRRWGLIILGLVIFVVIVGAGVIGTFAYLMYRQVNVQTVSPATGEEEFTKVRARFAGQTPYIELSADDRGIPKVHRELEKPQRTRLTSMHVLVWKGSDRKLIQFALPFWLMRLTSRGNIRIGSSHQDVSVELKVTAEDIERYGPGLLIDQKAPRGEQVLVWVE
jgi:hypothetical protein